MISLKLIDVDHEAGQRLAGAFGARELLAQAIVEIAPVVPAGQEVRDAAAHQPRAIHRVLQADRDDDAQVREKIRRQIAGETLRIAAAERDHADRAVVARQRDQRDAAACSASATPADRGRAAL